MNEIETQEKIAELREQFRELGVFSDDSSVREKAIAALAKDVQEDAKIFLKRIQNAKLLQVVLMSDLKEVSVELHKNFNNQFWRRTAIRAFAAAVDGIVFCLKELTHASAGFNKFELNDDENKFLLEGKANLQIGERSKHLVFKDNFKQTFRLFAQVNNFQCPTDFNQDGFSSLCETFELRHQLMHPKSFLTFCVTDEQANRTGKAGGWLYNEIQKLFEACNKKIHSNIETILNKQSNEI